MERMLPLSDRFLETYNRVDRCLRNSTKLPQHPRPAFGQLVDEARGQGRLDRIQAERCREYAELRNALVHIVKDGVESLAEPHPRVCERFETILRHLENPPRLKSLALPSIRAVTPGETIGRAVELMGRHDLSQLPVLERDECPGVITADDVLEWVSAQEPGELPRLLTTTSTKEVLELTAERATLRRVTPHEPIHEVVAWLEEQARCCAPVPVVLVGPSEKRRPTGMLTLWDLGRLRAAAGLD